MTRRISTATRVAVGLTTALLAVTACSSSKSSSSGSTAPTGATSSSPAGGTSSSTSTGGSSGTPIKIGVITDTTGVASSGYVNTEKGIKAYVDGVNAKGGVNGHKIEYVMADSQSTPQGALTAAQKLVQSDKVFAVISVTSDMFGAEPFLLKQGVPVIGTGFDGPEWTDPKNTNMLDALGVNNASSVFTTAGETVKKLGGTTCGSLGYIESPSASAAATSFVKSCTHAGLKAGLVDNVHFGTTDVGPIALAMKSKGVDSMFFATVPSTGFALAAALKQVGVKTQAILLPTGYGAQLLASKAGVQAAQGFYFSTAYAPQELNTAVTKVMDTRLKAAGEQSSAGYDESQAYLAMTAFARGVEAAGSNLTQKNFIASLRQVKDFDAEGLLAPLKIDFSSYSPTKTCSWYLKLTGSKFVPVPGLSPICGTKVSG